MELWLILYSQAPPPTELQNPAIENFLATVLVCKEIAVRYNIFTNGAPYKLVICRLSFVCCHYLEQWRTQKISEGGASSVTIV